MKDSVVIDGVRYVRSDKAFQDMEGSAIFGMSMSTVRELRNDFIRRFGEAPTSPEHVRANAQLTASEAENRACEAVARGTKDITGRYGEFIAQAIAARRNATASPQDEREQA